MKTNNPEQDFQDHLSNGTDHDEEIDTANEEFDLWYNEQCRLAELKINQNK